MSIRGWVYVITNKAMPGLVKVGYSTKDPVLRAKELVCTGSPHPYFVAFDALVEEPRDVEQAAHQRLAYHREGKEWFRCSVNDAINAIRLSTRAIFIEKASDSTADSSMNGDRTLVDTSSLGPCSYYDCGKPGHTSYKGSAFCEEHAKVMRKHRFASVRI